MIDPSSKHCFFGSADINRFTFFGFGLPLFSGFVAVLFLPSTVLSQQPEKITDPAKAYNVAAQAIAGQNWDEGLKAVGTSSRPTEPKERRLSGPPTATSIT